MCIIAVSYKPWKLTKQTLSNCWDNNDDGAGFSYVSNGEIKTVKELKKFNKFWKLFSKHVKIAEKEDSPMLLHFRIASHGKVSVSNLHPFAVNKNMVMCHNGILPIKEEEPWSDTKTFVEKILKYLPNEFMSNHPILWMIEQWMGKGNKMVFMNNKKKIVILNKSAFVDHSETQTYFSNQTFSYKKPETYSGQRSMGFSSVTELESYHTRTDSEKEKEALMNSAVKCLNTKCCLCGDKIDLSRGTLKYRCIISRNPSETTLCGSCYEFMKTYPGCDVVELKEKEDETIVFAEIM